MDRLAAVAATVVMLLIFPATAAPAASADPPVALLIQASGDVAYASGGGPWKAVRRNKFLYRGDSLKTGSNGACKLLCRETDEIRTVDSNTVVSIGPGGLQIVRGNISAPVPAGGIAGFLERKFTRVQKYTAVRRAVNRPPESLKTVRRIALSREYPDLVWESLGPLYSYRLTVGARHFDVPSTPDEIVRFTLTDLAPGTYPYRIAVLYQGEVLQQQNRDGTLRWLSETEMQALMEKRKKIEALAIEDGFLLANLMDDEGLKVAAMDIFQEFMAENPEANEIRPFLIKVLSELHLDQARQRESVRYHRLKNGSK